MTSAGADSRRPCAPKRSNRKSTLLLLSWGEMSSGKWLPTYWRHCGSLVHRYLFTHNIVSLPRWRDSSTMLLRKSAFSYKAVILDEVLKCKFYQYLLFSKNRSHTNFEVLLTVHLSIFILVINQLDAQNFCFTISLFHASSCFKHMCSSSGGQNCITQPLVSSHLRSVMISAAV